MQKTERMKAAPLMEFHISRDSRERYKVRDTLFNFAGNVVFGDLAASRELANQINSARGTASDPAAVVNPAALFAMGLIDEVSHALVAHYRKTCDPQVMARALSLFETRIGKTGVDKLLNGFVEEFPNAAIYRSEETPAEWLAGSSDGLPHREVALEEMMLLWLANQNSAFRPFEELFDDARLGETTDYSTVTAEMQAYFASSPKIRVEDGGKGSREVSLLDLLRAPMLAAPDSLSGQLAFLRENWSLFLGSDLRKLLLAVDVLKEEDTAIWMRFHPPSEAQRRQAWQTGGQGGHTEVPTFAASDQEYERFSPDVEWMPTAVLIAKSTYVWLAQLSKQYGRAIERLDQIPDEELDLLASRGLNSLWLIGIWERSRASKTIKRLCGQPDAVASAYSLASYHISADIGGEAAYVNLRDRAYRRGLRLASDMVPNHMGIDSTWVVEHPEWFLSRSDSPYPAYRFEGPDLSNDSRVEIKIEDHYYEQTDAAVVFRRRDNHTGQIDYVYHGNDGTSFPWNDTAQLNYLNPVVREQVIQTILQVARLFPIIRFDAAMTLARRHVQRLWFPVPGSGGAIPSRAEYSMTQAEFDAIMPHEFWRDVVDRVAAEVPGTLLLAEAFWLMEGYFVRTLGMHRVYNSAFMNMMRDEENAKYRSVLKNTLEFDPDIMKRYVNFMSNPDERTAIDQFGTGDKYFGVATLLATLPGLPMFGHGQVEAFTEKYGMEYQKPRYDERPDEALVARHQREIAPLLKQRALFAESGNFMLYDFWREDGKVDENVFAYSNRLGDQRAIVLFHNHYGETRGTIHHSATYADKGSSALRQRSLSEALGLASDGSAVLAYRDTVSNLEYLRRSGDLLARGLPLQLHAYQYRVFLNWRELRSSEEQPWDRLCDSLQGAGVPDLNEAMVKLQLAPMVNALHAVFDPALIRTLAELSEVADIVTEKDAHVLKASAVQRHRQEFLTDIIDRAMAFFQQAKRAYSGPAPEAESASLEERDPALLFQSCLRRMMCLPQLESAFSAAWSAEARHILPSRSPRTHSSAIWAPALGWCLVRALADSQEKTGTGTGAKPVTEAATDIFDRLRLRSALAESFAALGLEGEESWRAAARVRVALLPPPVPPTLDPAAAWWGDPDVRWLTGLHQAEEEWYFRKEAYEELLWWAALPEMIGADAKSTSGLGKIRQIEEGIQAAFSAAKAAGYRLGSRPQSKTGKAPVLEGSEGKPKRGEPSVKGESQEKSPVSKPGGNPVARKAKTTRPLKPKN